MRQKLSWALFLWKNIGPVFLVQGHERFSLLRSAKGTYEFKGGKFAGPMQGSAFREPFQ
jgi:hypothetical protein